jgi:hypothetical protein
MNRWYRGILVGGALVLLLFAGVTFGRSEKLNASEWAAWVQAVGSVLAILAAVAVADFHVRVERRTREDQQKSLIVRATRAVQHLHFHSKKMSEYVSSNSRLDADFVGRLGALLNSREDAVLGAPIWSIDSPDIVEDLLKLQHALADARILRGTDPEALLTALGALDRACQKFLEKYAPSPK